MNGIPGEQPVQVPQPAELLERLSKATTPETLAQAVADAACCLPDTTAVLVAPNDPGGRLRLLGVAGRRIPTRDDTPPGQRLSVSGWVLQTGVTVHCPDVATDPRAELARHYGFAHGSILSLPIKLDSQVRLVITLYSWRPGEYLLQAMPSLRTLADATALCWELLDLRRSTRKQERHLLALHEVSRLLAMSLDPDTVLSLCVDVATGLFDLDLCCILICEGGTLRIKAARGATKGDVTAAPDTGEPDLTPFQREGLVTECLSIQRQSAHLGYLVIGRRSAGLSDVDRRLLTTWTNMAGVLLDNVRLHADANDARENAVSVLLTALEDTAPGSRDLALSRSELAGNLAQHLKLPEGEVRTIQTAALLQDVGLLAAGETHSRVLAVADAFVRLRIGSANQTPVNEAAALIGVKENAGKQFDPGAVAALEAVVWSQMRLAPQAGSVAPPAAAVSDAAVRPEADLSPLTPREREILGWVAQGYSNREIAAALFLSEATVKTHVSRILQKLSLPDRTKAAVYLMRGRVHLGS